MRFGEINEEKISKENLLKEIKSFGLKEITSEKQKQQGIVAYLDPQTTNKQQKVVYTINASGDLRRRITYLETIRGRGPGIEPKFKGTNEATKLKTLKGIESFRKK